jgi:hypothetical protein
MILLQGRDGHSPERGRHRCLTLCVNLHGAHMDPELRQPAIGARDPVDPVDHDRNGAVGMRRHRERRRRIRRTQNDHCGRTGAGHAEAGASDHRQAPART